MATKGKILEGTVVSDTMDKTITVMVSRKYPHPAYGNSTTTRKKHKAHDADNKAKVGDRVRIIECRPLSKEKRFRLVEIIK